MHQFFKVEQNYKFLHFNFDFYLTSLTYLILLFFNFKEIFATSVLRILCWQPENLNKNSKILIFPIINTDSNYVYVKH
jgi:hypothetical protein